VRARLLVIVRRRQEYREENGEGSVRMRQGAGLHEDA
jgi:hypothetical protein